MLTTRVIDLTREIGVDTRVFPGSPSPAMISWSKMDVHGYDSEVVFLSTHTSTHMDAPSHFMTNATTIDKIDVSRFVSNAVIIRTNKKELDELITVDDIVESNTDIMPGDSIIFSTGWESEVCKEYYFSGNPGLSPEAAEYLIKRRINAVAIDSPSIDKGMDHNFTCHKILLSHEILIIENLCNLGQVNDLRFKLLIAPLKFSGATGSPVRAIAIIGQGVF